jgi:tetratricopeptide (TPR) repeat protein
MGTLKALGVALLGALLAGSVMPRAEALKKGTTPGHHLLYLPSGRYLKPLTFGYEGLVADLIYIWSIQYYSNYQIEDRYDYLDQIYRRVIAELDPTFVAPYLVGSIIMSVEAQRDDLAMKLLEEGVKRNPGVWILPFQAGYLCYSKLHDYACAKEFFREALESPDAPAPVRRFYAEMYNKMGDPRSSLKHWAEIHDTADSDYVRQVSWMHVHDLKIEVDLEDLDPLIASYREQRGESPRRIEDLVRAGLLSAVPVDPDGKRYFIDPATGKASCVSRRLLQSR